MQDLIPDAAPHVVTAKNREVITVSVDRESFFCTICLCKLNSLMVRSAISAFPLLKQPIALCQQNLRKHLNSIDHTRKVSHYLHVDEVLFLCRVRSGYGTY